MSETHNHTAHTTPPAPPAPTPVEVPKPKKLKDLKAPEVITRNGVSLTLKWYELLHGAKTEYQALEVNADNLPQVSEFLGVDTIAGILQSHMKKACQLIWRNSYSESGTFEDDGTTPVLVFDMSKFIAQMVDLTVTGQKLSELRDAYEEVVSEQQTLIASLGDLEGNGKDPATPLGAAIKKLNEFKGRILVLKDTIEKKSASRKSAEDEKTEASVPVN